MCLWWCLRGDGLRGEDLPRMWLVLSIGWDPKVNKQWKRRNPTEFQCYPFSASCPTEISEGSLPLSCWERATCCHVFLTMIWTASPPIITLKLLHVRYLIPEMRKLTNTVDSSKPLISPSASFMNPEALPSFPVYPDSSHSSGDTEKASLIFPSKGSSVLKTSHGTPFHKHPTFFYTITQRTKFLAHEPLRKHILMISKPLHCRVPHELRISWGFLSEHSVDKHLRKPWLILFYQIQRVSWSLSQHVCGMLN